MQHSGLRHLGFGAAPLLAAAFIGLASGANVNSSRWAVPYPAGTQAGDLAVLYFSAASGSVSTSGWSTFAGSPNILAKTLTSADLAATLPGSGAAGFFGAATMVFRNVATATQRTTNSKSSGDGSTSETMTGFTPGPNAKVLVFLMWDDGGTVVDTITPALTSGVYLPSSAMLSLASFDPTPFRLLYDMTPADYAGGTLTQHYSVAFNVVGCVVLELS